MAMDTITLTEAELVQTTTDHYELAAATELGTTYAKFNYWTPLVGDVPTKIYERRVGSVNYDGYIGEPGYTEGTQVGPR